MKRRQTFGRILEREALRLWTAESLFSRSFVRGKLRHDPAYVAILRGGLLPPDGTLVDVGCGRGVLLSVLVAAKRLAERGAWPADWPEPPRLDLHGIEVDRDKAVIASRVLSAEATIDQIEVTLSELPAADTATLIDVLHYLETADQEHLLSRLAAALAPTATVLVREADAAAGLRFALTRAAERVAATARGDAKTRFTFRSTAGWRSMLEALGFSVEVHPMSAGTPFANDLLVARRGVSERRRGPARR